MAYLPWPVEGLTLHDALERTTDRGLFDEWRGRNKAIPSCDHDVEPAFLQLIRDRRLVAYGRQESARAQLQLVEPNIWAAPHYLDWDASTVSCSLKRKSVVQDVRVFPVLMAPCAAELLDGRTLKEAFDKFVLGDPEVLLMGEQAIKHAPRFERVFKAKRCNVDGADEWRVSCREKYVTHIDHPDCEQRSVDGYLNDNLDAWAVIDAVEALTHRYILFFAILQDGEIEAEGLPAKRNYPARIPRSVWGHRSFFFNAQSGDLLEVNPDWKNPPLDWLLLRWKGVMLSRPPRREAKMFPVKPIVSDAVRSTTTTGGNPAARSRSWVETTNKAQRECNAWLEEMMRASPHQPMETKEALWELAQQRWPDTLSKRAFLAIRANLIRQTGFIAWGQATSEKIVAAKS